MRENDMEYRIAQKEHLPMILELYKQLIPEETPLEINKAEHIWEESERNNIKYFVALDDNKIAASCYLAIIPNLTRGGKSNGFIENVITDTQYRRQGIGKKVIQMAVEYARQNNCYKVVLQSNSKREDAHQFYRQCGFDGNSKRAFEIRF
jgi:GNAT superfamily N-acetyltransferase